VPVILPSKHILSSDAAFSPRPGPSSNPFF